MPKMYKTSLIVLLAALSADFAMASIVGSAHDNGDGTFTYSYEVDNTAGQFAIVSWSLEFDHSPGVIDWDQADSFSGGDVFVPDAWNARAGIPASGNSSQEFNSSTFAEVLTGSIQSGYSFTSTLAPGVANYYEFGALSQTVSGMTVGPVAPGSGAQNPEPTTLAIWSLLGSIGFIVGHRRRRRTAA